MTIGADWVGPLPAGWSVLPLKSVVTYNTETLPESTDPEWQFDYVEISDVSAYKGIIGRSTVRFGEAPSRARRIARRGDVLVSTVRTYLRAVAPVEADSRLIVSTGFAVLRPTKFVNESFLKYLCLSEPFLASTIARSTGVSYPAINASDLVRTSVAVPPVARQREIGGFLDQETAKIDALIAKQEQLIATLREDRTATITYAVTQGLDAEVAMKDSGVDWLDCVPRHWQLVPIKHVVRSVGVGLVINPSTYVTDSGVPFLLGRNVRDGWLDLSNVNYMSEEDSRRLKASRLNPGDVVVVRAGYPGRAAVIPPELDGANCASILILRQPTLALPEFITAFFNSLLGRSQVKLAQYGAAQEQINVGDVVDFLMPVPPLAEQQEIIDQIAARATAIDSLIAKAVEVIDTLHEYRAALITDAVTGKIDVRGAA